MTIHHTANDIGFFTGNVYNSNPASQDYLWQIKSALKTRSWVVVATGDGSGPGAYTAGDGLTNNTQNSAPFVNAPAIANSICNHKAWFYIKTPNAAAEQGHLIFQNISSLFGSGIRVKFSRNGYDLTTADNERPPTGTVAGDDIVLVGGLDDVTPTGVELNAADGSGRFNMGISDTDPFFWITNWPSGDANNTKFIMIFDFVDDLDASDDYPYIAAARDLLTPSGGRVGQFWPTQDNIVHYSGGNAASGFGASRAVYVESLGYNFSEGTVLDRTLNLNCDINSMTGNEDTTRFMWCRTNRNAIPIGRKGKSKFVRWAGKERVKTDHLNDPGSRNFVYVNGVWLPWGLSGTDCIL